MQKTIFTLFFLVLSVPGFSQVILSGEFRPKIEYRDGYKTLLTKENKPAFITAQRSRLNLSFKDKWISTKLSVQDVRIWGESPSKADASSVNVFEAWAEAFLNEALSIRLGRQVLSFDENRLMGAANWNDVGASHDLVLLNFSKNFDFQAGFAYNNDKSKNVESDYPVNFYKNLAFVRAATDLSNSINTSLIIIADGYQKEDDADIIYERVTYGGNLLFSNDSVKTKTYLSFYLQNGTSPEGIPVSAYFLSMNLTYNFTKAVSGIIACDYFSGDNAFSENNKYNSFNNLYGNGHNYYGYMDYFSVIDKDTKGGGLMDLYARANFKFNKKSSLETTCHYFSFTNDVADLISSPGQTLTADPYLGSEIDLVLKHKPVDNLEFNCGYSTMLAAPSMEILKGGDHSRFQHWAWVMITFKPEFFNSSKQ